MSVFGLGEVLGAPIFGNIRDRIGNKVAIVYLTIITTMAVFCFLYLNHVNKWSNLAYLMTFMWGLQDGSINTMIMCIFGYEFENEAIAFSCFNFIQSSSVFIILLIADAVSNPDFTVEQNQFAILVFTISCSILYVISYGILFCFKFN